MAKIRRIGYADWRGRAIRKGLTLRIKRGTT